MSERAHAAEPFASYVLPLRAPTPAAELTSYLQALAEQVEVIVVDGSPAEVFATHHGWWASSVRHVPPDWSSPMGKVSGVLTGLRLATCERVVIADDDVRYGPQTLRRVVALLDSAEVVRPQNAFASLPWHALLDTGRILLNRCVGGDWPGTLAVRRAALPWGYADDVLFENLELVRTVRAAGGREHLALDVIVPRVAPTPRHFRLQRVRQAYDELARPWRMAAALSVLPGLWAARRRPGHVAAGAAAVAALAEIGRRRAGGREAYPVAATLFAPLWVLERGVTAWIALGCRVRGGVRYRDVRLRRAATPLRELRRTARAAGRDGRIRAGDTSCHPCAGKPARQHHPAEPPDRQKEATHV